MKSEIWYTARNTFDPSSEVDFGWQKYLKWSKLKHLSELVSLDGMLNKLAFEPNFDSEEDWKFIITDGQYITMFFNSINYILEKTRDIEHYNLLAVVREPESIKADLTNDFEFIGYDMIEKNGSVSALTNCGGFDESFLPEDLNLFGLITEYEKSIKVQEELRINNPDEHHADCYLYEVWRHKTIGRKKK